MQPTSGPRAADRRDGHLALDAYSRWATIDPAGSSAVIWQVPVEGRRATFLLGAFDPPTNAHLALIDAASRAERAPGVLCLTKVLLARPPDPLLSDAARVDVLLEICRGRGLGLAFANRGTYLEIARFLHTEGWDASFLIGSDKLDQLADPAFYPDHERGVTATFEEVRFIVTPRAGFTTDVDHRHRNVSILEPAEVFRNDADAALSASDVRHLHRSGQAVDHLVPPEVARALRPG